MRGKGCATGGRWQRPGADVLTLTMEGKVQAFRPAGERKEVVLPREVIPDHFAPENHGRQRAVVLLALGQLPPLHSSCPSQEELCSSPVSSNIPSSQTGTSRGTICQGLHTEYCREVLPCPVSVACPHHHRSPVLRLWLRVESPLCWPEGSPTNDLLAVLHPCAWLHVPWVWEQDRGQCSWLAPPQCLMSQNRHADMC